MEHNVYHVQHGLATAIRTIADVIQHMMEVQESFVGELLVLKQQLASVREALLMHGTFDPRSPVFPLSNLARAVLEYLAAQQPFGGSPLHIARALNAPRDEVAALLQAMKQLGITSSPMRGHYRLGPPLSEAELLEQLGVRRKAVVDIQPDTDIDA